VKVDQQAYRVRQTIGDAEVSRCSTGQATLQGWKIDVAHAGLGPIGVADRRITLRENQSVQSDIWSFPRPMFVHLSQHLEGVQIVTEPDMQAMLDVAALRIAPARAFAAETPSQLIDRDVILLA